eukprot:301443-Alexandrium_andersonii.AAC.1
MRSSMWRLASSIDGDVVIAASASVSKDCPRARNAPVALFLGPSLAPRKPQGRPGRRPSGPLGF